MRNEIQQVASLHEKAVQAVASGEVAPMSKRRKKGAQKGSKQFDKHLKVNPLVWAKVQEILAGPHGFTKTEVINEGEVKVK